MRWWNVFELQLVALDPDGEISHDSFFIDHVT